MTDLDADGVSLRTVVANTSEWLAPSLRRDDGGRWVLTLTTTGRPHGFVDLSAVPPAFALLIEFVGAAGYELTPIRVSGLRRDCVAEIVFSGQPGGVVVTDNLGTLRFRQDLDDPAESSLFLGPGTDGRLVLDSGIYALAVGAVRNVLIEVSQRAYVSFLGWLRDPAQLPTVRLGFQMLAQAGQWGADQPPCPAVFGLKAPGGAYLRVTAGTSESKPSARLDVVGATALSVGAAVDISIGRPRRGVDPFSLSVRGAGGLSNVMLNGPTEVWIEAASRAHGLISQPFFGTNDLFAAPATVVTGLTGPWNLRRVEGSHVSGGLAGFELMSVAAADSGSRADTVRDAVVTGFSLASHTERRSAVAALESAHHIDPRIDRLPGAGRRYRWPRQLFLRRERDLVARLPEDAEFVDALARLARDKGAPGATRTKIAWCAYRLRHLSARSVWERLALTGYRLLGYGERPGPALLTWLVLALTATVLSAQVVGLGQSAFDEFLSYAFGPAGVLFQSGGPDQPHPWQYLVRAIVAVPLVTGLIALRNFRQAGTGVTRSVERRASSVTIMRRAEPLPAYLLVNASSTWSFVSSSATLSTVTS
ncbi:hypothetical protein HD601_005389 [Jiangella mangrovi]|uniref:Uncharacterized protein n=1 Tax=Jiangella mangrovi TaxID=1524084 RepID=A0A7W9LP09_9ACTN|nr:hypothetical protein [Jiangella mangrovi]